MSVKDEMKKLVDDQVSYLKNKGAHWSYMYECQNILENMLKLAKERKMDEKKYSSCCSELDKNLKSLRKAGDEYLKDMQELDTKISKADPENVVYVRVAYNFYHEIWMRTNALYSDTAQHLIGPVNEVKKFFDEEYFNDKKNKDSKNMGSKLAKLEKILGSMDVVFKNKSKESIRSLDNFLKRCNLSRKFEKISSKKIIVEEKAGAPSKSEVASATECLPLLLYEFCGVGNSYSFLNKLSEMLEILQKDPEADVSKMRKALKIDWERDRTTKRVSLHGTFSMYGGADSFVRTNSEKVYNYAEKKELIKRDPKFDSLLLPDDHRSVIESLDLIVNEPIELTKSELNDWMKRFEKYIKYLQSLSLQVNEWNKALKREL